MSMRTLMPSLRMAWSSANTMRTRALSALSRSAAGLMSGPNRIEFSLVRDTDESALFLRNAVIPPLDLHYLQLRRSLKARPGIAQGTERALPLTHGALIRHLAGSATPLTVSRPSV